MKNILCFLVVFLGCQVNFSQEINKTEQFPQFPNCETSSNENAASCFYAAVTDFVFANFEIPKNTPQNFTGTINVLFEVDAKGTFTPIYIDAPNSDLSSETSRVFSKFPTIKPASYNGRAHYSKFTVAIAIPLKNSQQQAQEAAKEKITYSNASKPLTELDSIIYKKYTQPEYQSNLNIPFTHRVYATLESALNKIGSNNHTATKPYTYAEVVKYYNFEEENKKIAKNASGWWARKFWNENLVQIQGEDYWFALNPVVDLQFGKSSDLKSETTFVNTRAVNFRGGLGKKINFTTTLFESQGRFAEYYNNYARSLQPSGGNPAIIPGIGIAKDFKETAFDFPLADAAITFTANKFIALQMGYGRNFIGDGYRSLFQADGTSPYPYFKINTNFWKIKYTNTYMWLKDVRPEVTLEKTYATKFMASHYLSWNVSNRLNLGFFESVIWYNANNRGFDMSFLNPIVFYRSVEFASSSKTGNALLGISGKYKYNNNLNFYSQFLVDEFSFGDIKSGNQSWKNKFGYQIGAKYFNAFKINNLSLQLEYNFVRPYVYSHSNILTNYGHNNQNIGHQWGGSFKELIAIARYQKGRFFADAKIIVGTRGLDFNTPENSLNYGGNIYKNYDTNRPADVGVKVGQGNKTNVFIAEMQAAYLVNPASNLKVVANFLYRNNQATQTTAANLTQTTNWFSVGLRTDVFNWYFDY